MAYLYEHSWGPERERLAAIEGSLDDYSIACLRAVGVRPGWRCLEVGAGAGSIARWLGEAVGPSGRVVATDLEVGLLGAAEANLEIRQHDIQTDSLEEGAYDLVHARKVLEHLPAPDKVLARMVRATRAGGWVVVEDADLTSTLHSNSDDPGRFRRVYHAFIGTMEAHGYHPALGLSLAGMLRTAGLSDVRLQGWTSEWTGAGERPSIFLKTFEKIRPRMVSEGRASGEDADWLLGEIKRPAFRAISATHYCAWGQKPPVMASLSPRHVGLAIHP